MFALDCKNDHWLMNRVCKCFMHLRVEFVIHKHTLPKPEKLINATDENLRIASVTNLREFYLTLERSLSSFFEVMYN